MHIGDLYKAKKWRLKW